MDDEAPDVDSIGVAADPVGFSFIYDVCEESLCEDGIEDT